MRVTVYVTAEKYEFEIDTLDQQGSLREAIERAKEGSRDPVPSDCRYLALMDDEEKMKLRQVQRG